MVSMGFKARSSSERQLWDSLTPMPQKTALLLMRGELSREEMAEELGCGVKTFDSHRLALLQHVGLASSAQLVHFGLRLGLVDVMPRPKAKARRGHL